jgi:hypothetical protein
VPASLKATIRAAAAILLLGIVAAAQTISIQFDGATFRVTGWQAPSKPPAKGWSSVFNIYAGDGDVPPLAGTYAVESGVLVFHPAYPIAPGVHYRAVFQPPAGGAAVSAPIFATFDGPHQDKTPTTHIVHIYPTANILPSNQLRLYIYFSAPMSRGESARYLHVLDENGKALEGSQAVFLPGEELWDPRFERLTMTFDPGRIKRGLTSNERIGPPIAEGKRYTLVIDRDWPDAHGAPLVAGARKEFRGGSAERNPPDPKQWKVSAPKSGTADAVSIDFPTAMNYPLLQRMIQVLGSGGEVKGTVSVAHGESEWRFTPREAWTAGEYKLVVDTGLEDLAGNHIGQPFDIDTFNHVTATISTQTISLPFTVR